MPGVTRISVSLDSGLVAAFNRRIAAEGFATRSQAVADLIRRRLTEHEWIEGREAAAAAVLVYDHHRRDVVRRLNDLQHHHHTVILAVQHFHLDHERCIEIVAMRGSPRRIETFVRRLRALKGIKTVSLASASTGRHLP